MPLVTPLSPDHDKETQELAEFFNETLGFCPKFGFNHATSTSYFQSIH
jgi:hypothetical protein